MRRIKLRKPATLAIAFTVAASLLAGCQDGVEYVVFNGCSNAFEVWTVDTPNVEPEDTAVDWEVVQPGQWAYSSTGPDLGVVREDYVNYVRVRRLDGSDETRFEIASSELSPPPEGVDGDLGIIVEGDHCPGI